MKRDTLKWILVAAVVVAAAAYLYFSERKPNEKQGRRKARTEQVAAEGHSKAFSIEPIEGITISAPKNALDKDREFKLEPVSDKTYDKVVAPFKDKDIKPLFVFDFDAGLESDEHLPGDVDVVWDLDKMGIPRELQDQFVVYRAAGPTKSLEYLRYKTHLDNGKLSFKTNQNSFIVGALAVAGGITMAVQVVRRIFEYAPASQGTTSIRKFFSSNETSLAVPFQDPSGDFVIHFRFSDTERPDGYKAFMENEKAVFDRLEKLEEQTSNLYEAKVDKEVQKEQAGYSFWQKLFSKKQVLAIRESISKEQILDSLVRNDRELARLNADPAGNLPPSILKIKEQIIRANEYLNKTGLHPFNFEIPVYLVDKTVLSEKINGVAQKYYFCGNAFLLLNYSPTKTDQLWEKFQCTIVHELFHARQQSYYAMIIMNSAPAESTAAVLEDDAAILWHKKGIFTTDATTVQGANTICTSRDLNYVFAYPLEKAMSSVPSADAVDAAYSLSYAIEGIRKSAKKDYLSMYSFVSCYSLFGPHVSGWKGWIKKSLGIDDGEFDKGWLYFGETNLNRVYKSQKDGATPKDAAMPIIELSKDKPVQSLKNLKEPKDYSVQTFRVDLKSVRIPGKGYTTEYANVFVSSSNKNGNPTWNPYLSFYLCPNEFTETVDKTDHLVPIKPNFYCSSNNNTSTFYLGVIATTQSMDEHNDYYVVGLFAPDTPKIRRVKDDQISFVMPRPDRDLTKNGLITGAVVSYVDKNGDTLTHNVDPKYFGKKVKWTVSGASKQGNGFSLSLHWYYKPDANTTYVSPESEAAVWGAKDEKKKDEPTANQKKPETNYWKQVASRGHIESTSIEDEKSTGDEVSSDYRSIAMNMAKSGNIVEFNGMAATEEKTSEGRTYVKDIYLEGEITYTEPPKEWVAGTEYKGIWEVEDDPYLMRIKEPYEFVATVTSSTEKACVQSRREKTDTGRSKEGGVQWLRNYTTTYMARHPEKDDPQAFTLTQTFTIAERPGSDLKATVILEYDYEWVGEPEEEVEEKEETVPEGGHWTLVKTEVYDQHMSYKSERGSTYTISGADGNFNVHIGLNGEILAKGKDGTNHLTGEFALMRTIDRTHQFDVPKQYYVPGDKVNGTNGACTIKTVSDKGVPDDRAYRYGRASMSVSKPDYTFKAPQTVYIPPHYAEKDYQEGGDISVSVPDKLMYPNGFKIVQVIMVNEKCYYEAIYTYEWVEDGNKKPEPTPAISGGHWKLSNTVVSNEPGMMSGGSDIVTVQGGNGNYNAHVERDGEISDREIRFDKPKTVYRPGEQITLNITNAKAKTKNTKDGIVYGVVDFSTAQPGQSTDYPAMDKHPGYNSGKVKGTATGVAPQSGKPGVVDFSITEQIMVKGSYTKTHTTYYYVWEE